MRIFRGWLLCLALCCGTAHAGSSVELIDPAPITVPAGVADDAVAGAIKRALLGRGWGITTERPGEIQSTLFLRGHEARIALRHDAREVRIAYLDSAHLDYEEAEGKRWIHSNYLGWIGFLVNDIKANLAASQ